jgi:hypothetical protein
VIYIAYKEGKDMSKRLVDMKKKKCLIELFRLHWDREGGK